MVRLATNQGTPVGSRTSKDLLKATLVADNGSILSVDPTPEGEVDEGSVSCSPVYGEDYDILAGFQYPNVFNVYKEPIVNISGPAPVNEGSTHTYKANVKDDHAVVYTWSVVNGVIVSDTYTDTIKVLWPKGALDEGINGSVSVEVLDVVSLLKAEDTLNVKIIIPKVPPTVVISGDTDVISTNVSTFKAKITSQFGANIQWTVAGGTILGPSNTETCNVQWTKGTFEGVPGNVSIVVTDKAHGLTAEDSHDVTIHLPIIPPTASISGPSVGYNGKIDTFTSTVVSQHGHTYKWTAQYGEIQGSDTGDTLKVLWTEGTEEGIQGDVTLTVVDVKHGESVTAVHPIKVIIPDIPPTVSLNGPSEVQSYDRDTYTATIKHQNEIQIDWTIVGGELISGANTPSCVVKWNQSDAVTTEGSVHVKVTDLNHYKTAEATQQVTIKGVNTRWTPNYNGNNSYVEIPAWTSNDAAISGTVFVKKNSKTQYLFDGNSTAVIISPDLTSSKLPSNSILEVNGIPDGTWKEGINTFTYTSKSSGRTVSIIGCSSAKKYTFVGQITDLSFTDMENVDNKRLYESVAYSYVDPDATVVPMPDSTVLVDEWSTDGSTNGTMTNFGTAQPYVPVLGDREEYNSNVTRANWKRSIENALGGKEVRFTSATEAGAPIRGSWLGANIPVNSVVSSAGLTLPVYKTQNDPNRLFMAVDYTQEVQHAFQYPNTFLVIKPTDEDYPIPQLTPVVGPVDVEPSTSAEYTTTFTALNDVTVTWEVKFGTIVSQTNTTCNVDWGNTEGMGSVKVTVTDNVNTYSDTETLEVAIMDQTAPTVTVSGQTDSVPDEENTYTATVVATHDVEYRWEIVNGTLLSQSGNTCVVRWGSYEEGTVKVIVTDSVNGLTATASLTVGLLDMTPIVINNVTGNSSPTLNSAYAYAVDVITANSFTTAWSASGGTITSQSNTTCDVNWTSKGSGWVKAVVTDVNGSSANETLNVNVVDRTPIDVRNVSGPTSVNLNDSATYSVSVSAANAYTTTWVISGGSITSQSNTSCTVKWLSSGNRYIRATSRDTVNGTTDSYTRNVTVIQPVDWTPDYNAAGYATIPSWVPTYSYYSTLKLTFEPDKSYTGEGSLFAGQSSSSSYNVLVKGGKIYVGSNIDTVYLNGRSIGKGSWITMPSTSVYTLEVKGLLRVRGFGATSGNMSPFKGKIYNIQLSCNDPNNLREYTSIISSGTEPTTITLTDKYGKHGQLWGLGSTPWTRK